jgi:hypothetical protein
VETPQNLKDFLRAALGIERTVCGGFLLLRGQCWGYRGAIGHAVGYFILATASINAAGSGFDPKPF